MRIDYTFNNWYTDETFTTVFDFATPIMADTNVVAKWDEAYTYDVRFEENGGTTVPDQQVPSGQLATEPNPPPTKEDFTFAGWYTDIGLTVPYNFGTPVTADLTLYAKWTALPIYTVSFEENGGTLVSDQQVQQGDCAVRPSPDPTKTNFNFDNWYADAALTTVFDFANTPITANITIYAGWIAKPVYTFSFDEQGGSTVPDQQIVEGNLATRPPDPTKPPLIS